MILNKALEPGDWDVARDLSPKQEHRAIHLADIDSARTRDPVAVLAIKAKLKPRVDWCESGCLRFTFQDISG
jgi:hypothetical protein